MSEYFYVNGYADDEELARLHGVWEPDAMRWKFPIEYRRHVIIHLARDDSESSESSEDDYSTIDVEKDATHEKNLYKKRHRAKSFNSMAESTDEDEK
jgi:hypothetical protein